MNRVRTPTRGNQSRIAFDVNSGPLSDLMCSGTPFDVKSPVRVCITSSERILLAPSSGIYPRELNPADLSLISGPKTVPLLLTSDSCTALSCSLERSSGRKRLGGINGFGIG